MGPAAALPQPGRLCPPLSSWQRLPAHLRPHPCLARWAGLPWCGLPWWLLWQERCDCRVPFISYCVLALAVAWLPTTMLLFAHCAGGEQQEQQQQPAGLGFAVLADVAEDAASGGEQASDAELETASRSSSPLKPDSGAFALLAGEGSAMEEIEEELLIEEEEGGEACEPVAASSEHNSDAAEQLEQQGTAAEAASGASFSFGGAARQQGHSRFAFATSPPAAAAAATSPVLSPAQLLEGARLFGFSAAAPQPRRPPSPRAQLPPGARASVVRLADLAQAASAGNGGESDDDTFYSAVPSRQPSAALTAYASARSLR